MVLNNYMAAGNLTRDIELRYNGNGTAIAKTAIAINKKRKDRATGNIVESVCYVDLTIWGRSAEIANQHLSKGSPIFIEGELVFEQWQDQTGQKRSKHSISVESFQFLPKNDSGQNQSSVNSQDQNYSDYQRQNNSPFDMDNSKHPGGTLGENIGIDDDDIPF